MHKILKKQLNYFIKTKERKNYLIGSILSLSEDDKNHLEQLFGINRLVWNTCLGYKKELWETYKRRNPCIDNKEELKLINQLGNFNQIQKQLSKKQLMDLPEYKFMLSCPAKVVQQCIRKLDQTFVKFYKGQCGYPKFKKKSGLNSFTNDSCGSIELTNTKHIKIKTSGMSFVVKKTIRGNKTIFNENTKINYITISKLPNGEYFISVNYTYEKDEIKKVSITKNKAVGVDRGINTTAMCSSGQSFNIDPYEMNKINKRIQVYQKRMARKVKGSSNRNKVRIKIAQLHNKKANIKLDFNHKLSHYLVKNHDLIVLEDLNIKNMSKSAKGTMEEHGLNVVQKSGLNRAILENNWGQLKDMISYKSELHGKHLVLVAPQFTSQKCSNCGHTEKDNRKDKIFSCLKCKHTMDADLNAAINIKTAGLAGFACREISLENSMKQELETTLRV